MKSITVYSLICFFLFFSSCISGSEKSQKKPNSTSLAEIGLHTDSLLMRVDSVLQFSVMVTSIFEDSKGRFWFGSHGDGLCMYDGNVFTYFTAGNGLPVGIDREFAPGLDWDDMRVINGGNQAGGAQEDSEGNIWINSAGHICKFDGKQFLPVEISEERHLPKGAEWKKYTDYLWFGYPDGLGACVYNGKKLECVKFPIEDPKGWDRISAKLIDSKGNLWLGTMDHGTYVYDGNTLDQVLTSEESGISRAIFEDSNGRIWLPQNGQGKDMYYSENGVIHNFSEEYLKRFPETKKENLLMGAQCIEQDKNGDIWFGTFGDGVYRLNGAEVTHLMPNSDESLSLSKSMYKDSQGRLLFGLGEGSVYILRGDSFIRFDESD